MKLFFEQSIFLACVSPSTGPVGNKSSSGELLDR
jgi:hypothetical protein